MLETNEYLKTIIETMQDGLMIVDPTGEIVSVNKAMEELTGYRRDELIGASCAVLECDVCYRIRSAGQDKQCDLFTKGSVRRRRCEMRRKDGSVCYVVKNAALLRGDRGEVLGGVETLTDISDMVALDMVITRLQREMGLAKGFQGLIGKSEPMRRVFHLIDSAAKSEAPILIQGESGTGKELAAKAIHRLGPRGNGPFVAVNCAALNDALLESELFGHVKGAFTGADSDRTGRFEASHGGDLFLDEIGDLPLSTQVKLLRALQEKVVERVGDQKPVPVDIRIISATNQDLKALMRAGRFREDLYYRIGVIPITLPPLRERKEDIPLLVDAFVNRIAIRSGKKIVGVEKDTLEVLIDYPWPGNVRELINVLEYAFVLCRAGRIASHHLPPEIFAHSGRKPRTPASRDTAGLEDEKARLLEALRKTGGRKAEAASLLGISRVTLWKRLKKHDIRMQPRAK